MGVRYILALVLMIAVMIGWSLFFGNRFAPEPDESATTETAPSSDTRQVPPDDATQTAPDGTEASVDTDLWTPLQESPDDAKVSVHTDRYSVVFNEKLAIAKVWELNQFPDRTVDIDEPLNLIPENALSCLALRFANDQLQLDLLNASWRADKPEIDLTAGEGVETLTFRTIIAEKLQVDKQLTFIPCSYFVNLAITFQNVYDEPLL
ncbi:membrane protein insertase YidC, partial [Candidatus Poribacteria bacterium]|nr:membrane protein insertase YidC [Candidatus Poribacteria bacterium]